MLETNFTPFPILTTERLVLRPLEITDAQAIFEHRNDDVVNTWLEDFRHATIEDTRAFIVRVQNEIAVGKTILWVLTQKGTNEFMGTVCLWNISPTEQKAETGYTLVSTFHRMGYMNEALVKAIDFGFNIVKLRTIEAYTHEKNEGSKKLLVKNGFELVSPKKPVGADRMCFSLSRVGG